MTSTQKLLTALEYCGLVAQLAFWAALIRVSCMLTRGVRILLTPRGTDEENNLECLMRRIEALHNKFCGRDY